MPRKLLQHVNADRSRHGQLRFYVRVGKGPRVRLKRYAPEDEAWLREEYGPALAVSRGEAPTEAERGPTRGSRMGTVAWLIDLYRASAEWADLAPATRRQREGFLRVAVEKSGHMPASSITPKTIVAGRDKRATKPHAANNFLKTMRGLCGWAAAPERAILKSDPTRGVKLLRGANDRTGFHSWTPDELDRFEARWPIGTRQRLAYELFGETGLRLSDVARVGRPHLSKIERQGRLLNAIRIRPLKTQRTTNVEAVIVVSDRLIATIAATPCGDLTFLATARGKPFGAPSLGNWFSDACRDAGVPGSAHGIRKAMARRDAERGATEAQLNAKYGWADGSRESATYVRDANRVDLAVALATETGTHAPSPVSKVRAARGKAK